MSGLPLQTALARPMMYVDTKPSFETGEPREPGYSVSAPNAPGPKGASDYPLGPDDKPVTPGFDEKLGYDPSDPYSGRPVTTEFRTNEEEEQLRRDLYQRTYGGGQPSLAQPAIAEASPFQDTIRRQPQRNYINYNQFMPRPAYQPPMFGGMYGMSNYGMPNYGMPNYGMPSYMMGGIGGMYGMNPMMSYQASPFMRYGLGGFNPFMGMFG